ncbi:hypothetical protein AMECASPLE_025759 [Ameca splendens]|uniref:Secreted protein n=1 Tax=Ameca splendens TaxID=208324 RepID=A0ABV0ZRH7_9TELE
MVCRLTFKRPCFFVLLLNVGRSEPPGKTSSRCSRRHAAAATTSPDQDPNSLIQTGVGGVILLSPAHYTSCTNYGVSKNNNKKIQRELKSKKKKISRKERFIEDVARTTASEN